MWEGEGMVAVTGGLSEREEQKCKVNGNKGGVADGDAGRRREWKRAGLFGGRMRVCLLGLKAGWKWLRWMGEGKSELVGGAKG